MTWKLLSLHPGNDARPITSASHASPDVSFSVVTISTTDDIPASRAFQSALFKLCMTSSLKSATMRASASSFDIVGANSTITSSVEALTAMVCLFAVPVISDGFTLIARSTLPLAGGATFPIILDCCTDGGFGANTPAFGAPDINSSILDFFPASISINKNSIDFIPPLAFAQVASVCSAPFLASAFDALVHFTMGGTITLCKLLNEERVIYSNVLSSHLSVSI